MRKPKSRSTLLLHPPVSKTRPPKFLLLPLEGGEPHRFLFLLRRARPNPIQTGGGGGGGDGGRGPAQGVGDPRAQEKARRARRPRAPRPRRQAGPAHHAPPQVARQGPLRVLVSANPSRSLLLVNLRLVPDRLIGFVFLFFFFFLRGD